MESPIFHLEGVVKNRTDDGDFEGPLSLILMLLQNNKVEIRDIKISEILDQYLAYLAKMQEMDLEIASEFVQMASYLLYIKTKMLLAGEKEVTELEQLVESLEHLRCRDIRESVKTVIPALGAAAEKGFMLYTRQQEPLPSEASAYDYRHAPHELLHALFSVFSRGGARAPGPPELRSIAPQPIVYSVRDKCRQVINRLKSGGSTTLRALYETGKTRSELVATFISVLELCALGSLLIEEEDGEFLVTFTGGDVTALLDSIEE